MEKELMTINDLCVKVTDGSHFSPENDVNGVYPMYSVKDMRWNSFDDCNCKYISKEIYQKLCKSDCRPLKNDILIAKDGSYLKYVFKAKEDIDACILSSIAILRPNLNVVNPDYLVHLMRTSSVKSAMANYVSGSALPRIILSDFKKMKLNIHVNKLEQNSIANILNQYDSLIDNNNKRIKLLEQSAQEIYKEWFIRFRFPGYKNVSFINRIPAGWSVEKIDKIGTVVGGGTPSTSIDEYWNGEIPWLSPVDLNSYDNIYISRGEKNISALGLQKSSSRLLPKNTILLSSRAPIGYLAIAENSICTNQGFKSIICDETKVIFSYLFFYLKNKVTELKSYASGATFPELSSSVLRKYKVIVPPIKIQKEFHKIVYPLIEQMNKLFKANQNLIKQRDLLLPRLMSGKLEVK